MHISVATATYFHLPFETTLEIIALAGFEHLELDMYWQGGEWVMAQHLEHIQPRSAIRMIKRAGLKVSSIHDGGGVLKDAGFSDGLVNPQLDEYLDALGYAPELIVFHPPHIAGAYDRTWWQGLAGQIANAIMAYQTGETHITFENLPPLEGYTVPLASPEALYKFCSAYDLGVTLDTTHYAQMGVDILEAAVLLKNRIRSLHLSDYIDGERHVFIGDGELPLEACLQTLNPASLDTITLECSPGHRGEQVRELAIETMVERLSSAKQQLSQWTGRREQQSSSAIHSS